MLQGNSTLWTSSKRKFNMNFKGRILRRMLVGKDVQPTSRYAASLSGWVCGYYSFQWWIPVSVFCPRRMSFRNCMCYRGTASAPPVLHVARTFGIYCVVVVIRRIRMYYGGCRCSMSFRTNLKSSTLQIVF